MPQWTLRHRELDSALLVSPPRLSVAEVAALVGLLRIRFGYRTADESRMAPRKQFQSTPAADPKLSRLLSEARAKEVSEDDLHEQRISFAFGNAPESSHITKESVRAASRQIGLKP